MSHRSGRRCTLAQFRETVLLSLALTVPLVWNPLGVLAFEPPKITLVRLAGLVLIASWVAAGALDRARLAILSRSPARALLVGVALFLAAAIAATITSVQPLISLLGSYDRLQGLLTQLAYAAVAVAAAGVARPTRLVDALLVASAPVCTYALLQQFGLDPLSWLDRTFGPPSTIGSSTALGGFLAMLAPLTLARAATSARALPDKAVLGLWPQHAPTWRTAGLVALAGLQVFVVVLTGVRGAVLGLLLGLAVFGLTLAAHSGRPRRAWLLIAGLVGCALALTALNSPLGPLERLRDASPYLQRLGSIGPGDSSSRERLLIWDAAVGTWAGSGSRLLVGFGPETQATVLEQRLPVELANRLPDLRIDRAHSILVDQLLTGGLIGLVALLALLLAAALVGWRASRQGPEPRLAAALLGALAAHVVESGFAFASASTLLVLWLSLGLLARLSSDAAARPRRGRRRGARRWPWRLAAVCLVLALLPPILSPVAGDLAYRRALAYHGGKDVRGEVAWTRRATVLAPERQVYPVALGLALANDARSERSVARRNLLLAEAEASARRAVGLNPLDPFGHYHLGMLLELRSEAERHPEALALAANAYDHAAELSPQRTIFLDAGGRARTSLGEPAAALDRYRAAAAIDGPNAERTALIGDSLLALGRQAEAIASYRTALDLAPRSAAAHAGLSRLLHQERNLAAAVEEARLAARFQQGEWRHREWLAQLELEAGGRAAALTQARAAARLAPPWERERLRAIVEQLRE